MKPQSPKKSMRASVGSPSKSMRNAYVADDTIAQLTEENQTLQFQIGDRDIEIDRMKTTLFALNEKLAMINDIRSDLDGQKGNFRFSEETRGQLQMSMERTSKTIVIDTNAHDDLH